MRKKSKVTDIILFVLIIVVATLVGISAYFHFNVKKRIYEDSYFINELGLIRGGIQRYAKFKVANINKENILTEIESRLKDIKFYLNKHKKCAPKFYSNALKLIKLIQNNIYKLENAKNKKTIIAISEQLWIQTNILVGNALNYHKEKFYKILKTFNLIIYLSIIFLIFIIYFVYIKIKKGIEIESITDKLTGLFNRMYFDVIFNYFIEKYKRNKTPFSMLIIDIDNFKKINDTYGHQKGDEILENIGEIIKTTIRKTDFAFRYGGEEFVIIFPDTNIETAYKVAQRLLNNISSQIKLDSKPVTISGGIGEYKGENPRDFFEKIDEALYFAKRNGKNQILKV